MITSKKLLCLCVAIVFLAGCFPTAQQLYPPPTPGSPHKMLENGLGLAQLWETTGVAVWKVYGTAPLALLGNFLVLVDSSKNELKPRLLGFDVHTGRLVWETSLPGGCFSFFNDQSSIYVGAERSLQSYDSSTGLLNWENKDLPSMKIYGMQIDGNNLVAYYTEAWGNTETQVIYKLDTSNGKLLNTQEIQNLESELEFQSGNANYWIGADADTTVFSTDKTTSQVRWKTKLDTFITTFKTFGQGTILTTAHMDDALYAIDMEDGHLKWQYSQQMVSNPVIVGEKVFVLISGEELTQLDLSTGKKMARARFSPQVGGGEENRNNLIAASGNLMVVYFADSAQVVVYQLEK